MGPSTFGLELGSQGFFESRPDWDVRAVVEESTIGIFVPDTVVDDFDAVNFYTFCTEQGFGFEPENSGSDESGLVNLTPGDLSSISIAQPTTTTTLPPTTTTLTPTTTEAPSTTVEVTTTTTAATDSGGDGGGFPWILVFGGGLGLAVAGWFLYNRPGGDPCGDLLEAWKAAQARCDAANKTLSEAREACETAKSDTEDLEDERKELCREWPPACWEEGSDGGWIEDDQGNRVTSRDLHLRRQALGDVWSDYKAGKLTAQEVEAKWRDMDTPEFREDQRQKDAAAKEELQDLEGELQMARDAMKKACDKVGPAEQAAKEACAAADAARKAYEDCVGRAMATPDPEDAGPGTDGGPSAPGGTPAPTSAGGGEESQPDPCHGQPPRKLQPAGRAEQISVAVDFALITEIWEGTERNTEAGREIALGLAQAAQELDLVGDLLSAREAGLDIGGSINGYAQSSFWSTTGGVVKGGAGAVLAGADTSFDVPTSLPTATVEVVETLAKLGSFLTGKVTDWMENAQVVQGRLRYFTQTITATPFTVWECRQGTGWVCVEKVWRYDVGKLQRSQPVRTRSFYPNNDLDRWRMQREFQRVANRAAGRIQRDAKRLIDWRRQHQAGPCD